MKKTIFLIALLACSSSSLAGYNFHSGNEHSVYICLLEPFQETFMDAGLTEKYARYKTQLRCEESQGEGSIFCKARNAKCTESSLMLSERGHSAERFVIFSDKFQRGKSISIHHNEPDLSDHNFDDRMSSYRIPSGWTVRFYEGKNYTGNFYTRHSSEANAIGFNNQISSIKILSRD